MFVIFLTDLDMKVSSMTWSNLIYNFAGVLLVLAITPTCLRSLFVDLTLFR